MTRGSSSSLTRTKARQLVRKAARAAKKADFYTEQASMLAHDASNLLDRDEQGMGSRVYRAFNSFGDARGALGDGVHQLEQEIRKG